MTNSIAEAYKGRLPLSISISLFLAVWFIYTLDHWLDAKRTKQLPSMHRHQFHQKHSKSILTLMIIQAGLGLTSLLYLPIETFYVGLVIAITVIAYFLLSLLLKAFVIKEVFIASIYTIGVFVGPSSLGITLSSSAFIAMFIVFGLALSNLILISMYEISNDIKDGSHSWPIKFGYKSSFLLLRYTIYILLTLISINAMVFPQSPWLLQVCFFLMVSVLYLILNRPKWFKKQERYRIYADMIFFIPFIILLT